MIFQSYVSLFVVKHWFNGYISCQLRMPLKMGTSSPFDDEIQTKIAGEKSVQFANFHGEFPHVSWLNPHFSWFNPHVSSFIPWLFPDLLLGPIPPNFRRVEVLPSSRMARKSLWQRLGFWATKNMGISWGVNKKWENIWMNWWYVEYMIMKLWNYEIMKLWTHDDWSHFFLKMCCFFLTFVYFCSMLL